METKFDYIIVGCGSAGAIVANRLAEDVNNKILVLEEGADGGSMLDIPSVGLLLQNTPFDWQYRTVSQSSSCFALNKNASHWPMGKIVGGTSMLNNMIYVRGHPQDFDEWFHSDKSYNSYVADILPYFKRMENSFDGDLDSKSSVFVSDLAYTSILPEFVFGAAKYLGFSISGDGVNCEQGFSKPKANLYKGTRWTSAHRLHTKSKSNVILRTNRFVEKILFKSNYEAYAVKYNYMGNNYYVKASKGIILSAGVIGSPKILMLSGIGRKHILDEVNITTKVDLPVGENLQDHVTTGLDLILLNQTLGIGIKQMLSPYSVFQYFWDGSGPWTTAGCEVLAFLNTHAASSLDNSERPDLQFMVMPLGIIEDSGIHLRHLMGISDQTWSNYFALLNDTTAITILPILLHPKSRGTVKLADKDPFSMPLINPNYLSDNYDVEVLISGINLIKKLIKTEEMQRLGARLNENVFPGCETYIFDTKPYWECYIRHLTITSYHPVGTCKMGHEDDPSAVVNINFQVKNTNRLFVIDGSVMPTLTSGNVNGAIMMLAEMASDSIKFIDYLNKGKSELTEILIPKLFC